MNGQRRGGGGGWGRGGGGSLGFGRGLEGKNKQNKLENGNGYLADKTDKQTQSYMFANLPIKFS